MISFFNSIQAFNAIVVDGDTFILNERHHHSVKYLKVHKATWLQTPEPVQLDINTITQKKIDELRKKELLSTMSERDKRILGLTD